MMTEVTERSLLIAGGSHQPTEWTVSQYASIEQVDRKTVLRWIAKGALEVRRTPGGHFRIRGTR
jgi:excisionase family DNA binding protein